jgi:hypothetical protein
MEGIYSQPTQLFMATSIGYAFSVLYVIHRLQVPYQLLLFPATSIVFYLGFPVDTRERSDFLIYQEIVKHIMMVSIFFTTNAIFAIG